jgi:hypothetical protein
MNELKTLKVQDENIHMCEYCRATSDELYDDELDYDEQIKIQEYDNGHGDTQWLCDTCLEQDVEEKESCLHFALHAPSL